MRDPLLPKTTPRDSTRQKWITWGGLLAAAILAGLFALLSYEPREHTYDVEVPVEILYDAPAKTPLTPEEPRREGSP